MAIKILHIADSYEGGGAESVFRDTIQASKELGYEAEYFISNQTTTPLAYIFSSDYKKRLTRKLDEFKPDIIHLQNYYHYLSPSVLSALENYKRTKKAKVIFTAHDYHLISPNSGLQYFENGERRNMSLDSPHINYLKKFDNRSFVHSALKVSQHYLAYKLLKLQNTIDIIISPSEFLKQVYIKYGIKIPIVVIRNPIELKPTIGEISPPQAEDLSLNALKIVFIGRVEEEKGLKKFIEMLNRYSQMKCELHVYGTGAAVNVIKSLQLSDNIALFMHGFVEREKLPQILTEYDLFVLPSLWYENAPISIIEAAKAGLPVLVPNYGGMKEMAALTAKSYYFDFNDGTNFNAVLQQASKETKDNYIFDESLFSFSHYKNELNKIYTNNLQGNSGDNRG